MCFHPQYEEELKQIHKSTAKVSHSSNSQAAKTLNESFLLFSDLNVKVLFLSVLPFLPLYFKIVTNPVLTDKIVI